MKQVPLQSEITLVRPVMDQIIVRFLEDPQQFRGSIVLPKGNEMQRRGRYSVVIATGPGSLLNDGTRREVPVKAGDVVLVHDKTATEFMVDNECLGVIVSAHIIGVIDPDGRMNLFPEMGPTGSRSEDVVTPA